MKKLIVFLIIGLAFAAWTAPTVSYAQQAPSTKGMELFKIIDDDNLKDKVTNVKNLPDVGESFPKFYAGLTKILLGVATILVVVGFVVAGVMYVSAQGDEETLKKAKNVALYTILGVLIIAAAYGITIGIAKLKIL